MTYLLINARPSPFGRKVAIAMIEKGLPFDVRYDQPWGSDSCTPAYNPLEQLPILVLPDGESVYDSTHILDWLELTHPEPPLLPAAPGARILAKRRQMLGERLMEIAQALIFETYRPQPSSVFMERQTRKLLGGMGELERLYASRAKTAIEPLDLGDIAAATTLLLFEFAVAAELSPPLDVMTWRGRYTGLTTFLQAVEARPSFLATEPRTMDVALDTVVG